MSYAVYGGPDTANLEPLLADDCLEQLEDWADVLSNEPDALRLLTRFKVEASNADFKDDPAPDASQDTNRVSEPPEPSP